jgi:signal transduction histidine kinase
MKRIVGMVVVMSLLLVSGAVAADKGTPAEAEALVKKAVAFIKANGKDKAFAAFTNKDPLFIDRDLYIFVYDITGKVMAHGQNPKMVGKDLSDLTDPDGKPFVKERIEIAKTKGSGWQDYKFTNPTNKKIEQKRAYVEKYQDLIVGSGAYK